ncbi:protein-L-isoaspartate(D-aspartate) O-methyltransferase [Homoserinimonas hongtaonis]|uniref:protein-L-isoaspartate(D-aspartate) O-methyltransferase n=1 Tax=Homoserinimonas hongtaonis TaxID=2079791 RepID=UPI000D3694C1|nr:protein-L-isoaspartate(D-aspartate) O-methyltransferase [Salinibacterium hongtaonis]AWB89432.1 protein-L-isoaspartate O-methyltransferase [Salinibacterium hongtaonis]
MTTESKRVRMVDHDLRDRGVRDERVLAAMARVPREEFVPQHSRASAFDDNPLPIGDGQTISQPYIVAFMAEAARITPGDTVLEIGTGSGYGAAVLASLAAQVHTIERHATLAARAAETLERVGFDTVQVHVGDGTVGLADEAPFDAIVVTASGPEIPSPLLEQLADGGRIVMPVERRRGHQQLMRATRSGDDFAEESLLGVVFVPLIGEHGYQHGR